MSSLVVTDTNIFIDIIGINALSYFFALDWQIWTTDKVMEELFDEQQEKLKEFEARGQLHIKPVMEEDHFRIKELEIKFSKKLSYTDVSVISLALKNDSMVLSGDRKLLNTCRREGLAAHGILWVLDQFRDRLQLDKVEVYALLEKLMTINTWLPIEECEKRRKVWSATK